MKQPASDAESRPRHALGDPIVLILSIGFILLFLALSIFDLDFLANAISQGFAWSALNFGTYFQFLMLVTFFIAIGLALTPAGKAKIGDLDAPELSTFKWISIILCTLLAGGGVFFAAGEPIYHFVNVPPAFDTDPD
ncbi:BCCT family transporter, partial [Halomonas sp. 707D4]